MNNVNNMLEWFGKRKGSAVQTGARKHVLAVLDVVSEIGNAIISMSEGDSKSALKSIDRMILSEREADRLEDRLCEAITGGEVSAREREDLLRLVRKMDKVADWATQAGIYVQMVVETEVNVPAQVWDPMKQMSSELTLEVKMLLKAIESLGTSAEETIKAIEAVKDQERIIDKINFAATKKILMADMDYKALMLMKGLIESLETSSDACKSCVDTLAVMINARK